MIVEFISSGNDWVEIRVDGKFEEADTYISDSVYEELLKKAGVEIINREFNDDGEEDASIARFNK